MSQEGELGPIRKEKFLFGLHVYMKMPKPPAVTIEASESLLFNCPSVCTQQGETIPGDSGRSRRKGAPQSIILHS